VIAGELIQAVVQNFRSFKSYSDSGSIVTEIAAPGKSDRTVITDRTDTADRTIKAGKANKILTTGADFVTHFVRTSAGSSILFRYQWTATGHFAEMKEDNLNFICSNLEGVFKRYPEEGLTRCDSLLVAVADATALSFGGTYYISTLLLDGLVPAKNWFFNRLIDSAVTNTDTDTGFESAIASLSYELKDELVNLYIDTEALVLKKLVVTRPTSTTTFTWNEVESGSPVDARVFDQYRF
jgi:hypothetical protein